MEDLKRQRRSEDHKSAVLILPKKKFILVWSHGGMFLENRKCTLSVQASRTQNCGVLGEAAQCIGP